jgi:type I restriction enzyme S subunit
MRKGDVLFGKRRAYQRKVGIAPFDGIFSAHGMVLRPKENIIDKDFFPFFIASDQFMERAVRISVGGLSPTINWKDLKEQVFEVPTIKEQKVLADKLWTAYRLKESYKKLLVATDEMVKSRFIAWSSEWKSHTTIRDLVDTSVDKASRKFKPEDIIRYIDISSVDGESNSVIGTTEYKFSEAPSRAQQCTRKGDILVSTVRPNLKNIAVNQLDEDNLVASSGFCVLRPKKEYFGLILAYVLSEPFTLKMVAEAKGSNYPAIHDSDILDYPITVPESHDLASVGVFVQQADKSKFNGFKSRFIEMFGSFENTKPLSECIGITFPGEWGEDDSDGTGVNVIRTTNFTNSGKLDLTNVVTRKIDQAKIDKKHLIPGDIILERSGGTADNPVGRVVYFEAIGTFLFNNFTQLLRCKDGVNSLFVFYSLYNYYHTHKSEIRSMGNKTTGIQNLKMDKYWEIPIADASPELQDQFMCLYKQAEKSKYLS